VQEKKPTWHLYVGPAVGALLCVIWFVRVWLGDNPTDTTILIVLAMVTMAITVSIAATIKKRGE
jgi:hypothetical protein